MKVTTTQIYRCSAQRYIESYFDPDERKQRMLEGEGAVSFTARESVRQGPRWLLRADIVERVNAPAAIRKVFGETSGFEEEARWQEGSDEIQITMRPDKLRDRLSISGRYRIRDLGDGTVEVTLEMDVIAKIFGIGGVVEKMAAKEVPGGFARDAAYFNAHFAT